MLTTEEQSRVLHKLAEEAVPENVDLWPALSRRLSNRQRTPRLRWLAAAGAAALIAALAAPGLLPLLNNPDTVNAETILGRAEEAASTGSTTVSTYHLVVTRTSKNAGKSKSEVWFAAADRQRAVQEFYAANGALESRLEVVFNGPDTWIERTESGTTSVIHSIGTTWTPPADTPPAGLNISELVGTYQDKSCMAARLEKTGGSVAGQPTYVVIAMPSAAGCEPSKAPAAASASPSPAPYRVNAQPAGSALPQANQLTVWVDVRSFLPLKTEVRDAQGNVVDQSEVSNVEYNLAIPDATFTYTARPGVPVSTFTGGDGSEVKRAMAQTRSPQPAKP